MRMSMLKKTVVGALLALLGGHAIADDKQACEKAPYAREFSMNF